MSEQDFAWTRTGKVDRRELVAGFEQGTWSALSSSGAEAAPSPAKAGVAQVWLADRWRRVLGLGTDDETSASFFDLGGDSLKFAELVVAIEDNFGIQIPIQRFFENPVLSNLVSLVDESRSGDEESPAVGSGWLATQQVMRRLEAMLASWSGDRLSEASLMVRANTTGTRSPIIWVCQSHYEFEMLARALGPDQPVYGLRSLHSLVPIDELTSEILDTVAYRYLAEIVGLRLGQQLIIGGNCSGGVIALALARKARQFGSEPSPLVLLNWMFAFGRYDGPVLLLQGMGGASTFALTDSEGRPIDWRSDFPSAETHVLPGAHGQYFGGAPLQAFAARLRELTDAPPQQRGRSEGESDVPKRVRRLGQTARSQARRLAHRVSHRSRPDDRAPDVATTRSPDEFTPLG